jgi:hypothetical protein
MDPENVGRCVGTVRFKVTNPLRMSLLMEPIPPNVVDTRALISGHFIHQMPKMQLSCRNKHDLFETFFAILIERCAPVLLFNVKEFKAFMITCNSNIRTHSSLTSSVANGGSCALFKNGE